MRWVRRLIGVAIVVTVMVGGWRFAAENDIAPRAGAVQGREVDWRIERLESGGEIRPRQ